jgi:small conductance mechanosensitive channel
MDLTALTDELEKFAVDKGFDIIGAIAILAAGAYAARGVGRMLDRWLEKQNMEPPLRVLLVRLAKLGVFALAIILALDKFGVNTTSLVAGIGVAGVGVGLALQGVLGNIFAGFTIIFTKPFRVGEYIEILGVSGQVTHIELTKTKLLHADRSIVSIPNHKILGEILHNYGSTRQINLEVGVAYQTDLPLALSTVRTILAQNTRVLKDPVANVGITSLGDSSIMISVQPWVKVPDFGAAQLEIYEAIVAQFRVHKIEIPFPQREVRLLGGSSAAVK